MQTADSQNVLCKSLEPSIISLYFARKMRKSCSDLLRFVDTFSFTFTIILSLIYKDGDRSYVTGLYSAQNKICSLSFSNSAAQSHNLDKKGSAHYLLQILILKHRRCWLSSSTYARI